MTRPFNLSRQQAEFIVDACEASGALEWMDLAAEIREHWGMGPYPAGSVRPPEQQGVVRLEVPVTCEKHYWHSIVGAPCPSCSAVNQGLTQNGQLVCPKCRYFFFQNESMS